MPTKNADTTRITHAWKRLQGARRQGDGIQQLYWSGELDRQLDEYSATLPSAQEAP